jgi:hypothetical protein
MGGEKIKNKNKNQIPKLNHETKERKQGKINSTNSSLTIQITGNTKTAYRIIGNFDADGPAAIIQLNEEDTKGIEWEDTRMFFRPMEQSFHSLRVKPSCTDIYGSEMKVFAVPPAPQQWRDEVEKKRNAVTCDSSVMKIHVQLFVEDLKTKAFKPYGSVVYNFEEPHVSFLMVFKLLKRVISRHKIKTFDVFCIVVAVVLLLKFIDFVI